MTLSDDVTLMWNVVSWLNFFKENPKDITIWDQLSFFEHLQRPGHYIPHSTQYRHNTQLRFPKLTICGNRRENKSASSGPPDVCEYAQIKSSDKIMGIQENYRSIHNIV